MRRDLRALSPLWHAHNIFIMAVLWPCCLIWSHVAAWILRWRLRKGRPLRKLPGKDAPPPGSKGTCIVTGGCSGLGRAAAEAFAREGYHVILACPTLEHTKTARLDVRKAVPGAAITAAALDLSCADSVRQFSADVRCATGTPQRKQWSGGRADVRCTTGTPERKDSDVAPSLAGQGGDLDVQRWLLGAPGRIPRLRVLVNCAGVFCTEHQSPCLGQAERTMSTNFLGHFLLSYWMLPVLTPGGGRASTGPGTRAVIINVSSFTHRAVLSPGSLWKYLAPTWSDGANPSQRQDSPSAFTPAEAYQDSKLCMAILTEEMRQRLQWCPMAPSVIAVDPGFVRTSLLREIPAWLRVITFCAFGCLGLLREPLELQGLFIQASTTDEDASRVSYLFGVDASQLEPSPLVKDPNVRGLVWERSLEALRGYMYIS